jgi:hypothetical protein
MHSQIIKPFSSNCYNRKIKVSKKRKFGALQNTNIGSYSKYSTRIHQQTLRSYWAANNHMATLSAVYLSDGYKELLHCC